MNKRISDSLKNEEKYDLALSYKLKQLKCQFHFNDMMATAEVAEKIGLLYYHLGNYHLALTYFDKTSEFYQKTEDTYRFATIKINEANVFTRLGKLNQAIQQMKAAEEVYLTDKIQYSQNLVGLYANLGLAYYDKEKLDSAAICYDLAEKYNETANNEVYSAVILNNKGDIELTRNNLNGAEVYYRKSLLIAEKVNYALLVATTTLNLGTVESKRENYQQAIAHFHSALNIYSDLNSLYFLAETNIEMSSCYEAMGDHKKALQTQKEYNRLEDSLKGAETLERIANLELEAAIKNEKQQFEILEKEKELADVQSKYQRILLYLLIGLILLGSAVVFLAIRSLRNSLEKNKLKAKHLKQREEMLQNELQFKKKEIENFSAYILEKNNLLTDLKDKLSKLRQEVPASISVNETLNSIKHNLHVDNDRKRLDLKIDQAHQEFIGRLTTKYPKLTKSELRLCSLLLMGLTTKDISNILNVEPDSVKKSRNRLRKKLALVPKSDLAAFLKSI